MNVTPSMAHQVGAAEIFEPEELSLLHDLRVAPRTALLLEVNGAVFPAAQQRRFV